MKTRKMWRIVDHKPPIAKSNPVMLIVFFFFNPPGGSSVQINLVIDI